MYFKRAAIVAICAAVCSCSPGISGISDPISALGLQTSAKPQATQGSAAEDQQYIQRVMALRMRYRGSTDIAGLDELQQAESQAAAHFMAEGLALAREERYEQAIEKYDSGLLAQPANGELQQARQMALGRKELARLYAEGVRAKSVGNFDLAETMLDKAASIDAQNIAVTKELADLERARKSEEQHYVLAAFHSPNPVQANFRDAKLREALKILCDPNNLNLVFDKNADNLDVTVSAKNVTFEQAFNMILQSSNAAYKVIGPNSVFIYENTPEKRKQYADRYFKTFHLSTLKAERMAEILKNSMELKTLVANNDLGTIEVRDTRETLDVVEKLIAANDRKPAEIMLYVEILEIDRSKAENLGLDFGSQITAQAPQISFNQIGQAAAWGQGVLTVPPATLNYLKSNTDARTLSAPRVRTVDGQPAKIHVGDRVPLQSASIVDATGQSRTLYDYHDIGIRLDVLPKYHLDDSIFVDLNVEVSTLGQNIGTAAQPAYEIGTRNVHTTMIVRAGETAVLGGLIQEDQQSGLSGILNPSSSADRTELVLTITPYVIRPQSLPQRKNMDFYSGTDESYATRTGYDYLKRPPASDQPPRYILKPENKGGTAQTQTTQQQAISGWQPAKISN